MAQIVNTADISPRDMEHMRREERLWVYNGLDTMVMREIQPKLRAQLDQTPELDLIYKFDRAQQGPAMSMTCTGMRVDRDEMAYQIYELTNLEARVDRYLQSLAVAVWDEGVNPRSPQQLKELLYTRMKLPVQYKKDKGEKKVSTDRAALEKLRQYYWATPIVNCVLALRDIQKKVQVLKSGVDADDRMRFGFNPAATETGRWSSSKNAWGAGTNGQNINDKMRRIFISDPGMKLAYPDLSQAESRGVAYLAQDEDYIAAVESGDVHTSVARMLWPELPWTGDLRRDRAIAETPFYRHFTHRDISKRGGHASNYYGTPFALSVNLKIPTKVAEAFQERYFGTFRGIRRWHGEVQRELQTSGFLTTPLGRRRHFFGRLRDDATLREAIAHVPQSLIVDIVSLGILRTWQELEVKQRRIRWQSHQHDGGVYSFSEGDEEVCREVENLMTFPVPIHGRQMVIPVETKIGYCWASEHLAPLGSNEARHQVRPTTIDILDWNAA